MSIRYDAMMVREYTDNQGQARSAWTKIGSGFVNKDGSIGVALDAIPLDWTKCKIILQVPKTEAEIEALKRAKTNGGGQQRPPQRRQGQLQQGVMPNLPRAPQQRRAPAPTPDYPPDWDDQAAAGQEAQGFADEEGT